MFFGFYGEKLCRNFNDKRNTLESNMNFKYTLILVKWDLDIEPLPCFAYQHQAIFSYFNLINIKF